MLFLCIRNWWVRSGSKTIRSSRGHCTREERSNFETERSRESYDRQEAPSTLQYLFSIMLNEGWLKRKQSTSYCPGARLYERREMNNDDEEMDRIGRRFRFNAIVERMKTAKINNLLLGFL